MWIYGCSSDSPAPATPGDDASVYTGDGASRTPSGAQDAGCVSGLICAAGLCAN